MSVFRLITVPKEAGLSFKMSGPIGPHVRARNKEKQFPQRRVILFPKQRGGPGRTNNCLWPCSNTLPPPPAQGLRVTDSVHQPNVLIDPSSVALLSTKQTAARQQNKSQKWGAPLD